MADQSDNTKPRTNIYELLPEVYRSDLNLSMLETSFNRHLTKDDTSHVSGFIGEGNPAAIVDRQIPEPTPHRQAYQLAPTMYNRVGDVDYALSYKAFLEQLTLLGVDPNRVPLWGDALKFNWVPPINIDMLVNYSDYFWKSDGTGDLPQYLTIENRCRKAQAKVASYSKVLDQRGSTLPIVAVSAVNNAFVVNGDSSDLFLESFVFYTTNTPNVNFKDKYWTTVSSSFDVGTDELTVVVSEPIAYQSLSSSTPPAEQEIVGRWWYQTDTGLTKQWNGSAWVTALLTPSGDVSLEELLSVYEIESNCVCDQDYGWDEAPWDDNQVGNIVWNTTLLAQISYATEADWITANGAPSTLDLWYDTTNDILYQRGSLDVAGSVTTDSFQVAGDYTIDFVTGLIFTVQGSTGNDGSYTVISSSYSGGLTTITVAESVPSVIADGAFILWMQIYGNFSAILAETTGNSRWNLTIGCDAQVLNQWSEQNHWMHKTEVSSFQGVRRAQIPILEYNSTIEMNEWSKITYNWKYRSSVGDSFETTTSSPQRFELEPIKGYTAELEGGSWYIYLFDKYATNDRDIDYSKTFVPGYKFRIVDDLGSAQTYTVDRSEYREINPFTWFGGVPPALANVGIYYMVTVVKLVEPIFTASLNGGGPSNIRIEPLKTSQGDSWLGYHVHWMLDTTSVGTEPAGPQPWDIYLLRSLDEENTLPINADDFDVPGGILKVASDNQAAIQELTITDAGVTQVNLARLFRYDGIEARHFALPGSNELRVYLNGVRQYGNYTELYESTDSRLPVSVLFLGGTTTTGAGGSFQVTGDYTVEIRTGAEFTVSGSTGNDGTYTVASTSYDGTTFTTIVVNETVPSAVSDGSMTLAIPVVGAPAITNPGLPNYTVVGSSPHTNISFSYVSGVEFDSTLNVGDIVRFEVCPAAFSDQGWFCVPVRTIEDETAFTAAVVAGTQPEYRSLTTYHKNEQQKNTINQYPLFNVYDVCADEVVNAAPLFAYKESADQPINANLHKRIVASSDGREYTFMQYLVDRDDNILYGYRNYDLQPAQSFWYSPYFNTLKRWDGRAWETDIVLTAALVPASYGITNVNDSSYSFAVTGTVVSGAGGSFQVSGDQTSLFTVGTTFSVTGSTGNDGPYTVTSSSFAASLTTIVVDGSIPIATADGTVDVDVYSFGISGNLTSAFHDASTPDQITFHVVNSTYNDGVYAVLRSSYSAGTTTIVVTEPIPNTIATPDGTIVPVTGSSAVVRHPIFSTTEPTDQNNVDYALWFDPSTNKLYKRNALLQVWEEIPDLLISNGDPTLQTVWKHGLNDERFVPEYVNGSRVPITVGSLEGDWQLADQWFYNPSHENKKEIDFTQLVTHMSSIVDNQSKIPGLLGGGVNTLTQNQYNYALGGTIHEYNDSYDTLISAINVNNTTPIGVIEFASEQYATALLTVKDILNRNMTTLLTTFSSPSLVDQNQYIAEYVVTQYKFNEYVADIYGDTTMYDASTDTGAPNWIATVPRFHLGEKYRPHISIVDNAVDIFHHDGHRSTVSYTLAEIDHYARSVVNTADTRTLNGKMGVISNTTPPATTTDFNTAFGQNALPGVYWYTVSGSTALLYRFDVLYVINTPPPVTLNGEVLSDGVYYFNTADQRLYVMTSGAWVAASTPGDVSLAWKEVRLDEVLARVILDFETRMFDIIPDFAELAFDYSTLTPTPDEQTVYDNIYEQRFFAFVAARNITAPLVNTSYTATNAFTWNYINSTVTTPPRTGTPPTPAASWQMLYTNWYGTPYPHLEPWKLQGYHDKPVWWDAYYADTSGTRRWVYTHATTTGMWENIRTGILPVPVSGKPVPTYPNGAVSVTGVPVTDGEPLLPAYSYFSVNIGDTTTADGYDPDALLPPYYNNTLTGASIRSLYTNLLTQISAPDADYIFGDGGPTEWLWTTSLDHVYDPLVIAFKMQPVRFMHYTFGPQFLDVDKLQVETTLCQVYSHVDALFHGDIYNTNESYYTNGLNQWYVNFNRFSGYDTNTEFRALWAGWEPLMTYQFAGIVDTSTFSIFNKYYDIASQDYNILLVNNGVFKDLWSDAFEVSVLSIPPSIIQYNNQARWRLDVDSLATVDRTISYYDVKLYPFTVDTTTDTGTLFHYSIVDATAPTKRFYVNGDQTGIFTPNMTFTVSGSTTNDGTYTVVSSVFDTTTNRTRINVAETITNNVGDGYIDVTGFAMPWETGSQVYLSSSKFLPAPLVPDTPYFIVKTGDRTFQLAETYSDALANVTIDLTSIGDGDLTIGEVASSFKVFGGSSHSQETWYHYALNKDVVKTFTPPSTLVGMQSLINLFDGYASYQVDQGMLYDVGEGTEFDPSTGRAVNWQLEVERFIDWAYGLRRTRLQVADRFQFAVSNLTTDEFIFVGDAPAWINGTEVVVSTTGSLPSPLFAGTRYYFAETAVAGVFKLSSSSNVNISTNIVDVTTNGSGTLYISMYQPQTSFPSFEINPTRNNMWINTPQGVLSNVISGPYADIHVKQTLFDQYGRPLTADKLNVFRLDKRSHIAIRPDLPNDVDPSQATLQDPYSWLHLGGGHFFLEGYEHFLLLNDYTVSGDLIYDPFLGLYTKKFDVDYYEKTDYSLRPTLGGYYLLDGQFYRNFEGSTVDLQNYYDTFALAETTEEAKRARQLLGYGGTVNYLDLVNMNSKSQFLFYRGMIQHKGSVASVKAYINSRRFIDAKVDEFWAWKQAEFGDSRPRYYPEIKLFSTDAQVDDVRLHFLATVETLDDEDVAASIAAGFIPVEFSDETRWVNYPEQRSEIVTPLFLDAEISSLWKVYVSDTAPTAGEETVDYWFDTSLGGLKEWNGSAWIISVAPEIQVEANVTLDETYVKLDQIFDDVRVIQRTPTVTGNLTDYNTTLYNEGGGITEYERVNSEVIKFQTAGFVGVMVMFTINPSPGKISPSKLIDTQSNVVVDTAQLWDPARGTHYSIGIHNVDLQASSDPALYSITENPTDVSQSAWNQEEVETRWLDTSYLGYLPYYDDKIYSSLNDRLYNWGKLAPWGAVKVYEWKESSVPPDQWAATVTSQANDTSIAQRDKATGTARQTLFKRTRDTFAATINGITSGTQVIDVGGAVTTGTSTGIAADNTAGTQSVLFSVAITGATATGLTGTSPFQANIFIDGVNYFVSVSASSASTFTDLINEINLDLLGAATATLGATSIDITSASTGAGSSVIIQDVNLFNSLNNYSTLGTSTLGSDGTQYTATITIDGVAYSISVDGDSIPTFGDLATAITTQLGATVGAMTVDSGNLLMSSATTGPTSTVSIVDGNLFSSLTGFVGFNTAVTGTNGYVETTAASSFAADDEVLFTTTGTLPSPLTAGTKYRILSVDVTGPSVQKLTLENPNVVNTALDITTAGSGSLTAVPAFTTNWVRQPLLHQHFVTAIDFNSSLPSVVNPTLTLVGDWAEGDIVDVYVNGENVAAALTLDAFLQITPTVTLTEKDFIDVVRPIRTLTQDEQAFDPDISDDGTTNVDWKFDYEYTQRTYTSETTGADVTAYYFWVEGTQNINSTDNTALSAQEAAQEIESIPVPYMVVMLPKDDSTLIERFGYGVSAYGEIWDLAVLSEQALLVPVLYRQAVLRGAASYLTEDNRYVWRFTRNLTLRDTLKGGMNLKSKHEEWFLFRQAQPGSIPRALWDKLTEALAGYTLADSSVRVPSLERELYDATNGTDTRFGLGVDQAFCDKNLALASILAYLEDPDNNFSPVNIDDFFAIYSFDTPANIVTAMNEIYNSFSSTHVNAMYFATLQDAFSTRAKYKELMKTSWVALHGIRVLEVGGLFDD